MGEASLFDVIEGAIELGIKYLSAYAFSTENWRRSPDEVRWLMGFNRDVIHRRRDQFVEMGVRVRWAGRTPKLWRSVINELQEAERMSADNDRAHPAVLRELRRSRRDRGRCSRYRRGRPARRARSVPAHRGPLPALPGRAGDPGRGPVRALLRGAAHVELPAVAVRVRRIGLPGPALARLRPPRPVARGGDVRSARPPLRRCPTTCPMSLSLHSHAPCRSASTCISAEPLTLPLPLPSPPLLLPPPLSSPRPPPPPPSPLPTLDLRRLGALECRLKDRRLLVDRGAVFPVVLMSPLSHPVRAQRAQLSHPQPHHPQTRTSLSPLLPPPPSLPPPSPPLPPAPPPLASSSLRAWRGEGSCCLPMPPLAPSWHQPPDAPRARRLDVSRSP